MQVLIDCVKGKERRLEGSDKLKELDGETDKTDFCDAKVYWVASLTIYKVGELVDIHYER